MDYEASSAVLLVPRQISQSLSSLRDRYIVDTHTSEFNDVPCSPIFQSIDEGCPTDIITFHHHEEVVSTTNNNAQHETHLPMDDIDSIDKNDLFSFDLDDINATLKSNLPADDKSLDNFSSFFENDLELPPEILDFIDDTSRGMSPQKADSLSSAGSSDPPLHNQFSGDVDNFPHSSGMEEEEEEEQEQGYQLDDEYIERRSPPIRKHRDRSSTNPSVCLHNEDLARGMPGERLVLTNEEKRLLVQMGHRVPTTFPLTRNEERAIRTMRRKIRNKLSAKASRARRQEYVAALESRVSDCHKENMRLRGRIKELEKDKVGLIAHLRQMRSYVNRLLKNATNSLGLKGGIFDANSATSATPPLLPLTVPRPKENPQQQHLQTRLKSSGKPASLLLVALMILASSTVLPLPSIDSPTTGEKEVAVGDQSLLSGRTRILMNEDMANLQAKVEALWKVDGVIKHEPPSSPTAIGFEDEIPVIKSKVRLFNKTADRVIIQTMDDDDNVDPLLIPLKAKAETVGDQKPKVKVEKSGPDLAPPKIAPLPYSAVDL